MIELANLVRTCDKIKSNVLFVKFDTHPVCALKWTLFFTDNCTLHMLSNFHCVVYFLCFRMLLKLIQTIYAFTNIYMDYSHNNSHLRRMKLHILSNYFTS